MLTNGTEGAQLRQEVSRWALEACLGIVDREAAGPVLDSEALAAYAGVYHLGEDRVTVIVEDGSLVVSAPILPPTILTVSSGDAYVVAEGPYRGVAGRFLRDSAGRISAIDVAGRLARRDPAGKAPPPPDERSGTRDTSASSNVRPDTSCQNLSANPAFIGRGPSKAVRCS